MIAVAPSILAADFARLGEQVVECERGGADRIHVDVMDGHFVPNLSMGPIVVSALKPVTKLPLEVHLMITDPIRYSEPFIQAGATTLIAHIEVLSDPGAWIRETRSRKVKVGLALNPDRPVGLFAPFLRELDVALCMTVFPGFGGQPFIPASVERIRELRSMINRVNPKCELEVDGGVTLESALECRQAGASVFVAGSSIFRDPDGAEAATTRMMRTLSETT